MRQAIAPGLVVAAKLVVSTALLWSGFRAISDDDYARMTIAQGFALHARPDPSGTSWLPLPFWIYGGVMKAFGSSLETAQATAVALGLVAAAGIWMAARALSLSPRAALLGSLLGAVFPHAAYYGAAMVPDYPTAVLAFAACATLNCRRGPTRLVGATLVMAATLCRYETWPIALVVVGYAILDGWRQPSLRRWLVPSAFVAPSGAIAWMIHGVVDHQDAWFFVKRVSAYRRALGVEAIPLSTRVAKQPMALVRAEPELALLVCGLFVALLLVHGRAGLRASGWQRPVVATASLVGFLSIGDLFDGAPTHHEERTLLVAWLGMALLAGGMLDRLLSKPATVRQLSRRGVIGAPWARPASIALLTGLGAAGHWLRPILAPHESFVDRSGEIAIGRAAARLVPMAARLALYTDDYGYFAIQTAFARAGDAAPLLRRDPRHRERDPLSSPEELEARLAALKARYLIVPSRHRATALQDGQLVTETSQFLLTVR